MVKSISSGEPSMMSAPQHLHLFKSAPWRNLPLKNSPHQERKCRPRIAVQAMTAAASAAAGVAGQQHQPNLPTLPPLRIPLPILPPSTSTSTTLLLPPPLPPLLPPSPSTLPPILLSPLRLLLPLRHNLQILIRIHHLAILFQLPLPPQLLLHSPEQHFVAPEDELEVVSFDFLAPRVGG